MHLSTILFIAVLIWGVLLATIGGVTVSFHWLGYLGIVTGGLSIILAFFNRWIWRLSLLHDWFVNRPIIDGTWHCKIDSNWDDSSTGQSIGTIEGYMAIRQTFSTLSLRLMTQESSSELMGSEIILSKDGISQIVGVYRNEPKQSVRNQSNIHYGAIKLQVIGKPPTAVKGQYWTDRKTCGDIELFDRHDKLYFDYATANQAFYPSK